MAKFGYLLVANATIKKSDIVVEVRDGNSKSKKQPVEYMLRYFNKCGDYYVPRYLTMFNLDVDTKVCSLGFDVWGWSEYRKMVAFKDIGDSFEMKIIFGGSFNPKREEYEEPLLSAAKPIKTQFKYGMKLGNLQSTTPRVEVSGFKFDADLYIAEKMAEIKKIAIDAPKELLEYAADLAVIETEIGKQQRKYYSPSGNDKAILFDKSKLKVKEIDEHEFKLACLLSLQRGCIGEFLTDDFKDDKQLRADADFFNDSINYPKK